MTSRRSVGSVALVVMAALVAITLGAMAAFAAKPSVGDKPPKGGGAHFTLSGSVDGLWPGGTMPLVVAVDNPYRFEIVLTALDVKVAAASAACPAPVLHIPPFAGEVRIPARGQTTVGLVASLDAAAPDECQGAEWGLTYTASARRT